MSDSINKFNVMIRNSNSVIYEHAYAKNGVEAVDQTLDRVRTGKVASFMSTSKYGDIEVIQIIRSND